MKNRYIRALLIVLAATGVEAQMIQAALQTSGGRSFVEQILSQSEIKIVRTDIQQFVNALRGIDAHIDKSKVYHSKSCCLVPRRLCLAELNHSLSHNTCRACAFIPVAEHGGSILIRAPSC